MELSKAGVKRLLMAMGVFAVLQGCATPDRRADILYRPVANVKGGSGDLYLVQGVHRPSGESAGVQWVLGKVVDNDGNKVANVVTDQAPANLVMDALNQELKGAGYSVIVTETPPDPGSRSLTLKDVAIRLNDTHSVVKDVANCSVKMSVEPRLQGTVSGSSSYQAEYSDTAVGDREQLPADILQKALQLLMTQAVPDIVKSLEKK
ncbi:MAG TPA: hypothetical protein VJ550_00035 [Geomonas sp.]|nr:hypothetical protein [Geomonas sp.]